MIDRRGMFSWRGAVFVLLSALTITAHAATSSDRPVEQEAAINGVIQNFVQAWNKHQIDKLLQLFTTDGSFKSPAGGGAQGRTAIRELLVKEHRDIFRESTLMANTDRITYPKPNVAVAIGNYTLSGIPVVFGIEVQREGTFNFQLVRRDNRWLISSARISKE